MAARADELEQVVRRGPVAWGEQALARLRALPEISAALPDIRLQHRADDDGREPALGMCGVLRPVVSLQPLTAE
jgi:hypothetical protein